jgi:hypothetical protein
MAGKTPPLNFRLHDFSTFISHLPEANVAHKLLDCRKMAWSTFPHVCDGQWFGWKRAAKCNFHCYNW